MKPVFFPTQLDFRKWLDKNHKKETELLVGYYKVDSGKLSLTWSESVDQAICFGWIDGIRRSIDGESYSIRFTPRKPKSIWSAINIKKVEDLTKLGLMKPKGIAAFNKREESNSKIYSYENEPVKFNSKFEKQFKTNKIAWEFFKSQAPSYQKTLTHWVMSAKQEITQINRLNTLIKDSEAEKKVGQFYKEKVKKEKLK